MRHEEAYDQLHHFLRQSLSGSQEAAHQRIAKTWYQARHAHYADRDLPFRIFNDLDTLLFNNHLHHRIHLSWLNLGRGRLLGQTIYDSSKPRISIVLNASELLDDPSGAAVPLLWGALIHEMLHAWAFIVIRPSERRAGHGRDFERAAAAMARRLGLRGLGVEDVID